ncbi:hypothetical protein GCM10010401_14100 [Rarobacter faecitabidus]|uniref:Uncharacterized protein n=1 Tax=Rarobacter faecitabidus TaxID=13243 RepID=A0A542ZDX4_RARFA|nr:hypothetical protein [Rarobacter faecitabidus]TQL58544.1 hypothetical protein FB461_1959 [Rarobacter faecitabidus]
MSEHVTGSLSSREVAEHVGQDAIRHALRGCLPLLVLAGRVTDVRGILRAFELEEQVPLRYKVPGTRAFITAYASTQDIDASIRGHRFDCLHTDVPNIIRLAKVVAPAFLTSQCPTATGLELVFPSKKEAKS